GCAVHSLPRCRWPVSLPRAAGEGRGGGTPFPTMPTPAGVACPHRTAAGRPPMARLSSVSRYAALLALLAAPTLAAAEFLRCEFAAPPVGDPFPEHRGVHSSPVVFPAAVPGVPGRTEPVIAALFANESAGYDVTTAVLRILRAADCTQLALLGGGALPLLSTASPAAADLDGDGLAEVVVAGADGSTLAFGATDGTWSTTPRWTAPLPAGASWAACGTSPSTHCTVGWSAFSIHDLDDDGVPEIIREGVVFSATGQLRSLAPPDYGALGPYVTGSLPLLANLDDDAAIELTDGLSVWEWVP